MYLGIDLGTSGVKVILMNENNDIIATHQEKLFISRLQPLWSEQNPQDWWQAIDQCMLSLSKEHNTKNVKAIGITGQMHGATLLDNKGNVLRPAILWNDGRSEKQCQELKRKITNIEEITGNVMMPGFTAPKLLWLYENEPAIFSKISKVLLPKDYIRYLITGNYATDMSDAAGTMWLNVRTRTWNRAILDACHLTEEHMPQLYEGPEITGYLKKELANRWTLQEIPIIAGGGDNAAGALGVGIYKHGQAMLSLGTSGVYFVATEKFLTNIQDAVHSFCHALPNSWHLMSVMLSATASLDWICEMLKFQNVKIMLDKIEHTSKLEQSSVLFLPYLSGERTPYNDPNAKGVFWGLTNNTSNIDMARAVIEGVSFALANGVQALHKTGIVANDIILIGGGSKSSFWCQMLADITGLKLQTCVGGEVGPALGAAKLAKLSVNKDLPFDCIFKKFIVKAIYSPNLHNYIVYQKKLEKFNLLYDSVKNLL